jgi:Amt family ammonium transporter
MQVTDAYVKPGLFFGGGFAQLTAQLVGIASVGVTVLGCSLIAWGVLKAVIGIRVSAAEEIEGLDVGEHGDEAYAGFAATSEADAGHASTMLPAGKTVTA